MSTQGWRDKFQVRKHEDAPSFESAFLSPTLQDGDNLYLVSSFAPTYLFRLIESMAKSPALYHGFLNVVLYVPGDLDRRSAGIVRFQQYLVSHLGNDATVEVFVNNAIQIMSKTFVETFGSKLRVSILHTSQKSALVKGCVGLVTSGRSDDEDFVTFVDAKAGDYNSPIAMLHSWDDYDYVEAQKLLNQVTISSNGIHPRGTLVSPEEVNSWLVYLAEWYETNPPVTNDGDGSGANDEEFDDDEEPESTEDLLDYLKSIGDFDDEDQYGWFEESDNDYDEYIGSFAGFTVIVDPSEAVDGHFPPTTVAQAEFLGPARATCLCGRRFFAGQGCPQGPWN